MLIAAPYSGKKEPVAKTNTKNPGKIKNPGFTQKQKTKNQFFHKFVGISQKAVEDRESTRTFHPFASVTKHIPLRVEAKLPLTRARLLQRYVGHTHVGLSLRPYKILIRRHGREPGTNTYYTCGVSGISEGRWPRRAVFLLSKMKNWLTVGLNLGIWPNILTQGGEGRK